MIKKIVFVQVIFLSFCLSTFAQEAVNILTPEPKLLWQKEFKTPIDSIAISSDGTKIVITNGPEVEKIKDDSYYTLSEDPGFRNPDGSYYKGIKYHFYGSKLYYLDNKGNILWEYEHKEPGKMFMLSHVVMSDDGEYIACSVIECKTEDRVITHVPPTTPPVPIQETKKMQVWKHSEILFFNSTGTLLWSFRAGGIPEISPDGEYVFIDPVIFKPEGEKDDFYFLDREGKLLWKIPFEDSHWTIPGGYMSKDGNYIAIGDTIYDKNKNILFKYPGVIFTKISSDGSIGIAKILENPWDFASFWKELICFDLTQKKILWRKTSKDEPRNKLIERFDISISNSGKYLITSGGAYIIDHYETEVRIYDLVSGEFLYSMEGSPNFLTNYGKDIVVCHKGKLYWYDISIGKLKWVLSDIGIETIGYNGQYMTVHSRSSLTLYEIQNFEKQK